MRVVRLLLALAVLAGTARAEDDRELARSRYATGQALFQRGRWSEALAEFEAAKSLMKSPAFDYNIGMCLSHLDRPGEAADALERYITAKPEDPDSASIWRMVAELRAEAVRRTQHPETPPQPVEKPPERPDLLPSPVLTGEPPPAKSDRRATYKKAGIATAVIGATLLVTAAITGGIAKSWRSDYDHGCDQNMCVQDTYWSAHNLAIATDTLIAVGAAAGIASIALWAVRAKMPVEIAPAPSPTGGSLSLAGRF
jgi:tetratricopeptide (TPR) repeat protein